MTQKLWQNLDKEIIKPKSAKTANGVGGTSYQGARSFRSVVITWNTLKDPRRVEDYTFRQVLRLGIKTWDST